MPSLFALCTGHWFTSLSTLGRYDEPGLKIYYGLCIILFFIASKSTSTCIRFGLIPLRLCAALMSPQSQKPKDETVDLLPYIVVDISSLHYHCTSFPGCRDYRTLPKKWRMSFTLSTSTAGSPIICDRMSSRS